MRTGRRAELQGQGADPNWRIDDLSCWAVLSSFGCRSHCISRGHRERENEGTDPASHTTTRFFVYNLYIRRVYTQRQLLYHHVKDSSFDFSLLRTPRNWSDLNITSRLSPLFCLFPQSNYLRRFFNSSTIICDDWSSLKRFPLFCFFQSCRLLFARRNWWNRSINWTSSILFAPYCNGSSAVRSRSAI